MFEESKKFNSYKELVLEKLDEKLADTSKAPNWEFITPANLKAEALHTLEERYDPGDKEVLRTFFKHKESATAYWNTIKNEDTTKFKPLVNYLRNRKAGTKNRNIELLAWLIDFQPRPFNSERDYEVLKKEQITSDPVKGNDQMNVIGFSKFPETGTVHRKLLIASILLTVALMAGGSILFWALHRRTGEGGCMVWTGEKYEQVSCDKPPKDNLTGVLPLDAQLIKHFRKITRPDTLTANAIGKVWCIKIDGQYEYYTDSAAYPLDRGRSLRSLSFAIMNNNPVGEK